MFEGIIETDKKIEYFPGGLVVKNPLCEGVVQSLIEELKSHMPCSMGPPQKQKKKKDRYIKMNNNISTLDFLFAWL